MGEVPGLENDIASRIRAKRVAKENTHSVTITFSEGRGEVKFEGEGWCGREVKACMVLLNRGYRQHLATLLQKQRKGEEKVNAKVPE